LAKSLIMLVRVLGLAAIVLGSLSWLTGQKHYLGPHIGIGFCVGLVVLVMAVLAMAKGNVVLGVVGLLLAVILPFSGLMQIPVVFHSMGAAQGIHIALALTIIGVAERLYSRIRRA